MRGKKTSPEDIYRVMTSYAITRNYNETARNLGMAVATVKNIVDDNKDKEEFVNLRMQKENEFAEKTSRIIDQLLARIENEVLNDEKEIPLNHLTTAIGTLYDKRALSRGESTENTKITFDLPPEVNKYAE